MTDILPLLEAAARESIPVDARVVVEALPTGTLWTDYRCEVRSGIRFVVGSGSSFRDLAILYCARAFLRERESEHTPAIEALRQAVTR